MCLKADPIDGQGYGILLTYATELKQFGAPSNETIGTMNQWLDGRNLARN